MNRSRPVTRWHERALVLVGLVLLGLWFRNDQSARAFQRIESQKLDRERVESAESGRAASIPRLKVDDLGSPASGATIGRIEVPRLRISAVIVEGTEPDYLDRAVGHFESTTLPGETGNCALAGHRDTFLRGLRRVRMNDTIRIETPRGTYLYDVAWGSVVDPHRVDVLDPTPTPQLTLVTCYPFEMVGHAPRRFVLRATLLDGPSSDLKNPPRLEESSSIAGRMQVVRDAMNGRPAAARFFADNEVPRRPGFRRAWHGTRVRNTSAR